MSVVVLLDIHAGAGDDRGHTDELGHGDSDGGWRLKTTQFVRVHSVSATTDCAGWSGRPRRGSRAAWRGTAWPLATAVRRRGDGEATGSSVPGYTREGGGNGEGEHRGG